MDVDADEESPDKSLYAVLNVSPSASTEEIRKSYRSLAQTYHPDKQPTDELRAGAAAQFATIQNAHEVHHLQITTVETAGAERETCLAEAMQ